MTSPTDLHGNPIAINSDRSAAKPKKRAAAPRTRQDKAAEKKSDRTAAFYEHVAPEAHPAEVQWRHGFWKVKRERMIAALQSVGTQPVTVHNVRNCGACAQSEWSETLQRRRLTAYYCHCRHCEPCARSKANKIAANLRAKLDPKARNAFRMITLTQKHSKEPLADQIRKLYKRFKKLRSTKEWKKTQKGGAVILECKHTGLHWHPHLHVICEGGYIDKRTLSGLWHKVTKDSYIVDLKLIDRGADAAAYVCKYITKSTDGSVWQDPDRAAEWITASKGVRTANTFGTWRKYPLLQASNQATDWQPEGKLVTIIWQAREGDQVSYDIIENLLSCRSNSDNDVRPDQLPVADLTDSS